MMRLHGSLRTGQTIPAQNKICVTWRSSHSIHAQRSAASKRAQGITAAAAAVTPAARADDRSVGAAWLPSQPSKCVTSRRSVQARYREQARDTEAGEEASSRQKGSRQGVPDGSFISSSEAAAFNELTAEAAQQAASQHPTPFNSPMVSTENPTESLQEAFSELFPVATTHNGSTAADTAAATGAAVSDATASDADAAEEPDMPSAMPTPHGTHASSGVAWQKDRSTAGMTPKQSSADKMRARLDDMASKYKALDRRLDSLETSLVDLLHAVKQKARNPAAAAAVGPTGEGGQEVPGVGSAVELPEFEYDPDAEDEKEGGLFDLKKLQTSLTENINRGYLESVKHLRELLMAYEWHLHGKELAERKGVAEFEKYCAEHDIAIDFEAISKLYQNPNDLAHLHDNKTRLLARSIIQTAVDERYCSIYFECTNTAKELAHTGLKDLIPDSAGKVGGVIKDVLPLPGFLKK